MAAVEGAELVTLDDDRALLYSDLVLASLSGAARIALEELMANGNYVYQSDFAKKHQAHGRAEGRAEGKAEGKAEGEATAILTVLQARGIAVTPEQRRRVFACSDSAMLERWIAKAVAITVVDDLFAD